MNEQIKVSQVRLIDENGKQVGVVNTTEALESAAKAGFDLVEVSPNAVPPVCKIMDFGKYKYELGKKEKQVKKKQHVIHVKEIRLRPKIETHDYEFKMRHARNFIEAGNRVKASVLFRGREMAHQEIGVKILERLVEDLEDIAKIDRPMKQEGRNLIMYFTKK